MDEPSKIVKFLIESDDDDDDWKEMASEPEEEDQYEVWLQTYKPVTNKLEPEGPFDGFMFETYGDELQLVRNADPSHVWTYVTGDDNEDVIVAGYHHVNRIGYFITELPWKDGTESFTFGEGNPKDAKSVAWDFINNSLGREWIEEWQAMPPEQRLERVTEHASQFDLEHLVSEIMAEVDKIVTETSIQRRAGKVP